MARPPFFIRDESLEPNLGVDKKLLGKLRGSFAVAALTGQNPFSKTISVLKDEHSKYEKNRNQNRILNLSNN
jgi:hypothetical protein